mgnify:CR=1 FL=1
MEEETKLEKVIKILTIIFLLSFSIFLTSIYEIKLEGYTFYRHFFYLPAVLSAFWWGRKGMITPIFVLAFFLSLDILRQESVEKQFSTLIEMALLFIVALLVAILSEEKTKAMEEERKFKLMTAHYFFNPICIAEGFLHLAMENAPQDIKEKLEIAQIAVQRIKKVVKNVVEKGEIHE